MSNRPGGVIAKRPLHFYWICDKSGSMGLDGKMQALNRAISDVVPAMQQVAEENPQANVLLRVLQFSHGAEWQQPEPIPLQNFQWTDLTADPLVNAAANLDILFLIDTSGSMGRQIDAVKSSCVAFAEQIEREGANVRLGLVGFDIGGHRGSGGGYTVHTLSRYTIGIWPFAPPMAFKSNVESLSLSLFGGGGCYLANPDTVDIFPHVINCFQGAPDNRRILVIISDEMGSTAGLPSIVPSLRAAQITTYVLGVGRPSGAHEILARDTGGKFWNIQENSGRQDFSELLSTVAQTIAQEMTMSLRDGTTSAGTDIGRALFTMAEQLHIPPMENRALPPVLVLLSDGQPTDDFEAGLQALNSLSWGKKAVRIAIAIGRDAETEILQRFLGNSELMPLQANNAEQLTRYIRWASTAVLQSVSAPASRVVEGSPMTGHVNLPMPDLGESDASSDVW